VVEEEPLGDVRPVVEEEPLGDVTKPPHPTADLNHPDLEPLERFK
jgi:hypothetical protein